MKLYSFKIVRRNPKGEISSTKTKFMEIFKESIRAITHKHYFSTEKGYQGQLLAELNKRLNIEQIFPARQLWNKSTRKL